MSGLDHINILYAKINGLNTYKIKLASFLPSSVGAVSITPVAGITTFPYTSSLTYDLEGGTIPVINYTPIDLEALGTAPQTGEFDIGYKYDNSADTAVVRFFFTFGEYGIGTSIGPDLLDVGVENNSINLLRSMNVRRARDANIFAVSHYRTGANPGRMEVFDVSKSSISSRGVIVPSGGLDQFAQIGISNDGLIIAAVESDYANLAVYEFNGSTYDVPTIIPASGDTLVNQYCSPKIFRTGTAAGKIYISNRGNPGYVNVLYFDGTGTLGTASKRLKTGGPSGSDITFVTGFRHFQTFFSDDFTLMAGRVDFKTTVKVYEFAGNSITDTTDDTWTQVGSNIVRPASITVPLDPNDYSAGTRSITFDVSTTNNNDIFGEVMGVQKDTSGTYHLFCSVYSLLRTPDPQYYTGFLYFQNTGSGWNYICASPNLEDTYFRYAVGGDLLYGVVAGDIFLDSEAENITFTKSMFSNQNDDYMTDRCLYFKRQQNPSNGTITEIIPKVDMTDDFITSTFSVDGRTDFDLARDQLERNDVKYTKLAGLGVYPSTDYSFFFSGIEQLSSIGNYIDSLGRRVNIKGQLVSEGDPNIFVNEIGTIVGSPVFSEYPQRLAIITKKPKVGTIKSEKTMTGASLIVDISSDFNIDVPVGNSGLGIEVVERFLEVGQYIPITSTSVNAISGTITVTRGALSNGTYDLSYRWTNDSNVKGNISSMSFVITDPPPEPVLTSFDAGQISTVSGGTIDVISNVTLNGFNVAVNIKSKTLTGGDPLSVNMSNEIVVPSGKTVGDNFQIIYELLDTDNGNAVVGSPVEATITVDIIYDPLVAVEDLNIGIFENTSNTVYNVISNDDLGGRDNSGAQVTIVTQPTAGTITASGTTSINIPSGINPGNYTVTYKLVDLVGSSPDSNTVNVTYRIVAPLTASAKNLGYFAIADLPTIEQIVLASERGGRAVNEVTLNLDTNIMGGTVTKSGENSVQIPSGLSFGQYNFTYSIDDNLMISSSTSSFQIDFRIYDDIPTTAIDLGILTNAGGTFDPITPILQGRAIEDITAVTRLTDPNTSNADFDMSKQLVIPPGLSDGIYTVTFEIDDSAVSGTTYGPISLQFEVMTFTPVVLTNLSGIVIPLTQFLSGGAIDVSGSITDLGGRDLSDLTLVVLNDGGSGVSPVDKTLVFSAISLTPGQSYTVTISYNDSNDGGSQIPTSSTVQFRVQSVPPPPAPPAVDNDDDIPPPVRRLTTNQILIAAGVGIAILIIIIFLFLF